MALRILKKGLPIIAPFENQLLPFVHKLWSPMVQRFSPSQDVVVLRLSFELLCVTASTSKSFIRRRCLEQVLPSICQFIEKQANVTQKQRLRLFFCSVFVYNSIFSGECITVKPLNSKQLLLII